MISYPERPKEGRILEIAIVISVALHLLFGGMGAYHNKEFQKIVQRLVPTPKATPRDLSALSTTITLEKRTRPQPQPQQRPQRRQIPIPPQPRVVPRVAVVPKAMPRPHPKPAEIARVVPHAQPVDPKQVARIDKPRSSTSTQKISEQKLAEMEQRFSQTIAMARANSDPIRVPPQAQPQTMKRAKLDVAGIDDLMRRGEGILTPRDWFAANVDGDSHGQCYYVDYQIQFSDGQFDSGPVYWPICYARRKDPFANHWRGFPLPGPPEGWQPTPAQLSVIAAHPLLRLYFPDRFPDAK